MSNQEINSEFWLKHFVSEPLKNCS